MQNKFYNENNQLLTWYGKKTQKSWLSKFKCHDSKSVLQHISCINVKKLLNICNILYRASL